MQKLLLNHVDFSAQCVSKLYRSKSTNM